MSRIMVKKFNHDAIRNFDEQTQNSEIYDALCIRFIDIISFSYKHKLSGIQLKELL